MILAVLGAAYPLMVYLLLGRVPALAIVMMALALVGARLGVVRGAAATRFLVPILIAVAVATGGLALADATLAALAYPILMSLGMAAAFGFSLRDGPSLIELFASLTNPDPSPSARRYMRKLTMVWTAFLVANAMISGLTLAWGDTVIWALYNGLISYILMGALFVGDVLVRRRLTSS
ncbi:hypothetical protein CU669_16200 [Paramagnetospirillum kuznetsovii]|uniref:DNA gyrase subunit B n=1 Tax=Paramagnetospirillum kuznetsovii TaxID=2053833 RepID=A0A364NUR0_9PROT|nr:hypothetical protein CU669_16200 [Paramagnetospirillum kuznetsovii]